MAAPSLKIPVSLDLNSLREQTQRASDRVGETLKGIGQAFKNVNAEMLGIAGGTASSIALGWTQSLASIALKFALLGTASVGIFKLISGAVNQSREDMQAMVDIADKSKNTGISPEFFQAAVAEAKKLKIGADELETALTRAFDATKIQFNDDGKWDEAQEKISDITKAMNDLNISFGRAAGFQGFEIFRNAKTQEDKIRGVLVAMTELEAMGEKAAALNLSDKMFGAAFTDRIRQGRVSAEGMLEALKQTAEHSGALVGRAKELDDQLKIAQQRLDQAMKPSFANLTTIVLGVKSLWVDIVGLMAQAAELANKIRPGTGGAPGGVPAALNDQLTGLQNRLRDQGLTPQQRSGLEAQLRDLQAKVAQIELRSGALDVVSTDPGQSAGVPLPRARPVRAPGPENKTDSGTTDFDRQVDSINRHIAALQADAIAVGLTEAAHAQLRTELSLLQAAEREGANVSIEQIDKYTQMRATMGAQQALTAAGITLNKEHADSFTQVTTRIGDATQALEKIKIASEINFGRGTAFLTPEDVAIAQRLRALYGEDIPAALAGSEAAALRLNNAFAEFSSGSREVLKGFASDMRNSLQSGATAWQSFAAAGVNALNRIADKLTNMAIDNLWTKAFGGASGGGFLATLFSGGGGGVLPGGAPIGQGGIGAAATGVDNWRGGPIMVGERGPEILNLPRGSQVVPNDISRGVGGGAANMNLTVVVQGNGDKDLMARMEVGARRVVGDALTNYDRSMPDRVASIRRDPRAR